jgi:sugar lactone lactonase YvrE
MATHLSCLIRTSSLLIVSALALACSGGGSTDSEDGEGGGPGGPGSGGSSGSGSVDDVVHQIEGVEVATLAGSNAAGAADGDAGSFNNPANLILDAEGQLIVADYDNDRTRRVLPTGVVSTLTNQAGFTRPFGLTFLDDGNLLVQTDWNEQGQNDGTTGGVLWLVDLDTGAAEAVLAEAGRPRGLGTLPNGRVVMSDVDRHDIRIFNPSDSSVTQLAGNPGAPGFADGTGADAAFNRPYGLVVTAEGNIIVADQLNHRIRMVTESGVVTTLAGGGSAGMVDGDIGDALFDSPQDLAIDSAGNVYVSDVGNHRIRRISTSGKVETVAGDGTAGYKDGSGGEARFFGQEGIDVSPDGSVLYVADGTNGEVEPFHRVRKIALP